MLLVSLWHQLICHAAEENGQMVGRRSGEEYHEEKRSGYMKAKWLAADVKLRRKAWRGSAIAQHRKKIMRAQA